MKVIDLMNKISNEEKLPEVIRVCGRTFNLMADHTYKYVCDGFENDLFTWLGLEEEYQSLNDEVEIIEEPKKIEKLLMDMNSKIKGNMTADYDNYMVGDIVEHNFDVIHKKINELIDEVNKLKENRYENKM